MVLLVQKVIVVIHLALFFIPFHVVCIYEYLVLLELVGRDRGYHSKR